MRHTQGSGGLGSEDTCGHSSVTGGAGTNDGFITNSPSVNDGKEDRYFYYGLGVAPRGTLRMKPEP